MGNVIPSALLMLNALAPSVEAQMVQVVASSPTHGDAGVPLVATVSFTFDRPVTLQAAEALIGWDGVFAYGGEPIARPTLLSSDARTISFTVRHRINSDYFWFVFGQYDSGQSGGGEPVAAVPYVLSYTTAEIPRTGAISGAISFGEDSAGKAAREFPTFDVGNSGIARLLRNLQRYADSPPTTQSAHDSENEQPSMWNQSPASPNSFNRHHSAVAYTLVLIADETYALQGGAVVDASANAFWVDHLREGRYYAFAFQLGDDNHAQVFGFGLNRLRRFGFHDPDNEFQPRLVFVSSGETAEVGLVLHDLDWFSVSAREADARIRSLIAKDDLVETPELLRIGTDLEAFDGRSPRWSALYRDPATNRKVMAGWDVLFAYTWPLEIDSIPPPRPIPQSYIDSDVLIAMLGQDDRIATILEPHPAAFQRSLSITCGDLQFEDHIINPAPERILWRVDFDALFPHGTEGFRAYVDMSTGEPVDVQVFEPRAAATARVHERRAFQLATQAVGEQAYLQLLQISLLSGGIDEGGSTNSWSFKYGSIGGPAVTVDLGTNSEHVSLSETYQHPDGIPFVPDPYVDSDEALAIANAAGGSAFRSAHGGLISLLGGYNAATHLKMEEFGHVSAWGVTYSGSGGGTLSVLVDMATGDVLASDLYEPLEAGMARSGEPRAASYAAARARDPEGLRLLRIHSIAYQHLGHGRTFPYPLYDGISAFWSYLYYSPSDGSIEVTIDRFGRRIIIFEGELPADRAIFIPPQYVDTDAAMEVAEQAGGAAFRNRYVEVTLSVSGGATVEYPPHEAIPIWEVRYITNGASLVVLVDMQTGRLLETISQAAREASPAAAVQAVASETAARAVSDPGPLSLFQIATVLYDALEGMGHDWKFSYAHPVEGRVDVFLSPFHEWVEIDESYRHPPGATAVPAMYVDLDAAISMAEKTSEVADFRARHGRGIIISAQIEGGYAESLGPSLADRPVWLVRYFTANLSPRATLDVVLDMMTGDLLPGPSVRGEPEVVDLPAKPRLISNHPNPFNPSTTFTFDVPQATHVTLHVFDVLGRKVAKVVDEHLPPGRHEVVWSAHAFASGTYYARIAAGTITDSRTLVLAK